MKNKLIYMLIRYYLPFSIRVVAYISIGYFTEVIIPSLFRWSLAYGQTIYFLAQVLLFEIIYIIARKLHRPSIIKIDQWKVEYAKCNNLDVVAFNKEVSQIRNSQEIYIISLFIFYLFNLLISLCVKIFFGNGISSINILLGLLGLLVSLFSFIGFVLIIADTTPKEGAFILRLFGIFMQAIAWVYVYFGIINLDLSMGKVITLFL